MVDPVPVDVSLGPATRSGAGASAPACNAPFSSLYLDPVGDVRACCQNRWQLLGNISTSSLREIWSGSAAAELRDRVGSGRLDLGCEECAMRVRAGAGDAAYLHVFDDLAGDGGPAEWPRQLELALSNSCNLQCTMCNGELSSAIRIGREGRPPLPRVYDDRFFEELDDFLPHLDRITFLGGEPFLGREPLRVMDRLVELGLRPSCHVTTNGTVWTPRVRRIVEALPMHLSVSIDGATATTNESIRLGVDHDRVVHDLHEMIEVQRRTGGGVSLSFSLQRSNVGELVTYLRWADELDVDVHVNPVLYPPDLSLHHLPADDLAGIIVQVEAAAASVPVGRNSRTLDGQLEDLRGLLRDRVARSDSARSPVEHAQEIVAAGADRRGVHHLTSDRRQMVDELGPDPTDLLGLDVTHLVGGPLAGLMPLLIAHLGHVTSTDLVHHDDGVEERRIVLLDGAREAHLTIAMAVDDDGRQRWFVSARHLERTPRRKLPRLLPVRRGRS